MNNEKCELLSHFHLKIVILATSYNCQSLNILGGFEMDSCKLVNKLDSCEILDSCQKFWIVANMDSCDFVTIRVLFDG